MSEPQTTDTPKKPDASAPPPPHRLAATPERSPSGMGCGVCAVLAGLAIIALAVWLRGDIKQSPRELLPDYTVLYIETAHLDRLTEALDEFEHWNKQSGGDEGAALEQEMEDLLRAYLGSPSGLNIDTSAIGQHAAFALVPTQERDLAAAAFVDAGSKAAARRLIEGRTVTGALPRADTDSKENVRLARDEQGRYVFPIGRWVVITQSRDLEAYLREPPKGKRTTLAQLPVPASSSQELLTVILKPFDYDRLRRGDAPRLPKFLEADRGSKSKAQLAIRVLAPHRNGVDIQIRDITKDGGMPLPRTWFGWIGYLLLWCVALIVGLILLLVVVTLSLAAYFYLEQWWQGELSPPTPPQEPSLSPGLKEDLERNPTDFTAPSKSEAREDDGDTDESKKPNAKKKSVGKKSASKDSRRKKKSDSEDDAL